MKTNKNKHENIVIDLKDEIKKNFKINSPISPVQLSG